MATTRPAAPVTEEIDELPEIEGVDWITREEGIAILDRQARKYLGMSGEEFVRRYRAGEIEDPDRSDVVALSMLLPFADE
jgi:hypothetical protein